MIYTNEWAFIHIPRTAGMAVKHAIPDAKTKCIPGIQGEIEQHQPYHYWQRNVDLADKTVFSIVRDPYKRAISLWLYCTSHHKIYSAHLKGTSFQDFWDIDFANIAPNIRYNMRTTQCEYLTGLSGEMVETVYKIEDGLAALEHKINVKLKKNVNSLPTYNYMSHYTEETYDLITDIFAEDFEQFGYEKKTMKTVV